MPDISMCKNIECERKEECYRFMATPNPYRQSYMNFDHDACKYFLPLDNKEKKSFNLLD